MNQTATYIVAKQFSRFPGGRSRKHGPKSGEEFRDEVLIPLYEANAHLLIDLTGTAGYPASFLDESFGELGKKYGLDAVRSKLQLRADDDPNLVPLIWGKIEKAAAERGLK